MRGALMVCAPEISKKVCHANRINLRGWLGHLKISNFLEGRQSGGATKNFYSKRHIALHYPTMVTQLDKNGINILK